MRKTIKKANSKWILLFLLGLISVGVQAQYNEVSIEWIFKNFEQGTYVNKGNGTFVPLDESTDLSSTVINSDGTWTNEYNPSILGGPFTNGVNANGVTRVYVGNVPGLRGIPANGSTLTEVIIVPMYKYILPTGEEIAGFGGVTFTTEGFVPFDPSLSDDAPCTMVCMNSSYEVDSNCKCVLKPEPERRPCEKAFLADHCYYLKDGIINKAGSHVLPIGTTLVPKTSLPKDLEGKDLVLSNTTTGFNSALYKVDNGDGKIEYVYATQGTDMTSKIDWINNVAQGVGIVSEQYTQSIANAKVLRDWAKSNGYTLSFTGHSLGGGMANANALATGLKATIYNPAGLSDGTIKNVDYKLDVGNSKNVTAYTNRGEVLNAINLIVDAPVRGTIHYVGSSFMPVATEGSSRILNVVKGVLLPGGMSVLGGYLHTMGAVFSNLDCN